MGSVLLNMVKMDLYAADAVGRKRLLNNACSFIFGRLFSEGFLGFLIFWGLCIHLRNWSSGVIRYICWCLT